MIHQYSEGDLVERRVGWHHPALHIAQLKRDYGSKLTFWGGLNTQRTLPHGTPEEVRAEARKERDFSSAQGWHVFAPAQGIQGDVPFRILKPKKSS